MISMSLTILDEKSGAARSVAEKSGGAKPAEAKAVLVITPKNNIKNITKRFLKFISPIYRIMR